MCRPEPQFLLEIVRKVHENLPFNLRLGLKVSHMGTDGAGFRLVMKSEFRSNWAPGALDDAIVSAVLDATGNLMASVCAVENMQGLSYDEVEQRVSHIASVQMHIDRIKPAVGLEFLSIGTLVEADAEVAVIRTELKNENDVLIAMGTSRYILE